MAAHTNLNILSHNKWNNLRSRYQFALVNGFGSKRTSADNEFSAIKMKATTRFRSANT